MRSLLTRLALVGLVGIALAGCGTSNGTPLPNGSIANNSGGGAINTTPGVGPPPLGSVPSKMIDSTFAVPGGGPFTGYNTTVPFYGPSNFVQALVDPVSPAVPSVPPEPFGGANDLGSHQFAVSGNGTPVLILKFPNAGPNLTYPFGLPGNAVPFTYSQIISHFWFGTKANAQVTLSGTPTAGDTVSIIINGVNVGYTVSGTSVCAGGSGATTDTLGTIVANLVANLNASGLVGPNGTTARTYGWVDNFGATRVDMTASLAGTAGNSITLLTLVQNCTGAAGGTEIATPSGPFFAGGSAATQPCVATSCTFTGWSIELVGNGTNPGPGAPASTYDVRVGCSFVAVGNSQNRFVCSPLPVYGALPVGTPGAPAAVGAQPGTYTVPVQAVAPNAAGAFTPINPQLYLVLTYGVAGAPPFGVGPNATNPAESANPGIDYIYAAQ